LSPKLRIVMSVAFCVIALDVVTKSLVAAYVSPYAPFEVIPGFFQITHARNPGGALGLFRTLPPWVFVLVTIVALGLIRSFYAALPSNDRYASTALGLIVAGAIGNLIDRVFRGAVVDFLQFDLGLFIFPDFNVADSGIVIGVALLMLDFVANETSEAAGDEDAEVPPPDAPPEGPATADRG